MSLRVSQVAKVFVLTAVAVVLSSSTAGTQPIVQPNAPADQTTLQVSAELAKAPYEVRLRKLHLVRPDLIPFPIFFEVYC